MLIWQTASLRSHLAPANAGLTLLPRRCVLPGTAWRVCTVKRFAVPLLIALGAYLGGLTAVLVSSHGLSALRAQSDGVTRAVGEDSRSTSWATFRGGGQETGARPWWRIEAIKPAAKGGKSKAVDDSGSGVLIRLPGKPGVYVLTNNHVVGQAPAQQITVNLADNRILKPVRVWADPESDVALLAAPGVDDTCRRPSWATATRCASGSGCWRSASPFGLNQTVTHGIISARERGQVSLGSTIRIKDFLQTDAAINPGSSGGPLVNLDGEVIGINTAIASPSGSNTGIAFSIPINMVEEDRRAVAGQGQGDARLSGRAAAPAASSRPTRSSWG